MERELTGTVLQNDVSAIGSLYNQLIKSWNEMNSETYSNLFTADGSIVGFDGSQANSRKEIYEHLSSIFADHAPARYVTIIREIRILSATIGLVRGVAGMIPRNEKKINAKTNAIQSMIAVKQEDRFRIALFQNTPAAFHGRPEDAEQLTDELQKYFDEHGFV